MSQRTEAILILRQAREILIQRLSERIVEAKEEILEDAGGTLYLGGIDEIYDQLVTRLAHVNSMLSHLPPEDATVSVDAHAGVADGPAMAAATVLDTTDFALAARADLPALPSPGATGYLSGPTALASFRTFGTQIHTGDFEAAGQSLAELFAIDPARGRRCAETFAANVADNPDVMLKVIALRKQIAAGNFQASLALVYECFGLQGMEAIAVVQTLYARLEESRGEE